MEFDLRPLPLPGLLLATLLGLAPISVQAVQTADGTVYFNQVPTLIDTAVNFDTVRVLRPKYDFRIALPAQAQEPLKTVMISQREGFDAIAFRLQDTRAFRGKDRKQPLPLAATTTDVQGNITVTFAEPIAPGTDFTIRLRAHDNPDTGGIYLFGVTAFPEGEKAHGQFLGFGRIHIYDGDSNH